MTGSKAIIQDAANKSQRNDEKEFGLWANEQAVTSIVLLFFGGVIGVAGMFENWEFAASVIPASFLLFLIEWPRGCRQNGKATEPRRYQTHLANAIRIAKPLRNYYLRAILFLFVCIPSCFLLPTVFGGLSLFISSIIYFAAAINGEEWKAVQRPNKEDQGNSILSPPQIPPPRNPNDTKI